jgi:hypothetical protein
MPGNYNLITSVGLEIELEDILFQGDNRDIPDKILDVWRITHDASCEKDAFVLGNSLVFPLEEKIQDIVPGANKMVLGGEFVSSVVNVEDVGDITKDLCGYAISKGESLHSSRAGMHIHVNFQGASTRMLQESLKLWEYFEDVFYYIGGMGYRFRGLDNDFTYCRPLTRPICVPVPTGYAKSVDLELITNSKPNTFWNYWGDIVVLGQRLRKYIPVRYHGYNITPVFKGQGSIEFRVFNKSLNPSYIQAVAKFCSAFGGMSVIKGIGQYKDKFVGRHSIFEKRNLNEILGDMVSLCSIMEIGGRDIDILGSIITQTPEIVPEQSYIYSHLQDIPVHWSNGDTEYVPVDRGEIKSPRYKDLHVLRGER